MKAKLLPLALLFFACRAEPRYVDSNTCASCHPAEWDRWKGSDHDRAMQIATPENVLGDANGPLVREGDSFRIDQNLVRYTFGVDPLQQYLVELPGGRLQPHPIAWDVRRGVWFDIQTTAAAKDDPFHWTGRYQNWSSMCAECHSTHVEKNYDPETDSFATTFQELDVGCQSCHGPGSRHVELGGDSALIRVSRAVEIDTCAGCHSHRSRISAAPLPPGAPLTDQFRPSALREGLYFADGQIQHEVFEYGSFAQSKMFQKGVVCSDCHDPHALKTRPGNSACTKCHDQRYDSPAHHRHESGQAACAGCHMPVRTYMGIDQRHDHSFRVPRPDLSVELGTPNACTQHCHQERGNIWAASVVAQWFPGNKPLHYGQVFDRARRGIDVRGDLVKLATTATVAAIVRTTALELLQPSRAACLAAAREVRNDASPLVREAALACGEGLPEKERELWALPALEDSSRLVRLEAARLLIGSSSPRVREKSAAARAELEARHRAHLDLPEGWFNLAVNAEAEGRDTEAEKYYRRALEMDRNFLPAKVNLQARSRK